jgi:asparagine synthase (glutamine-hydrolysing)
MCGIAGFFDPRGLDSEVALVTLERMVNRLHHRGPDDSGLWVDERLGVALGHRRLSILDLSRGGHQPMVSHSGRYLVVFNGEIYNHLEVRNDLDDVVSSWRGNSDTETLLQAIEEWGLDAALKRSTGMFAFALWDNQDRSLTLVRDRLGEKPVYYGWQGGNFLFGSELKALVAHPYFKGEVNREALPLYLQCGYMPNQYSIYHDIYKLLPGTYLKIDASNRGATPLPTTYWSLSEHVERTGSTVFQGTEKDAVAGLKSRLQQSIALELRADVPVGAFLSGGLDSSTVVALMQEQSIRPIKTFTIGFEQDRYNEAVFAKKVAEELGTDHTELYVTANEARDVIPKLTEIYDEPFGDSSAIPTYLVAQLASEQVTVALSGDGGDELLGGYSRYSKMEKIWSLLDHFPLSLRQLLAGVHVRSSVFSAVLGDEQRRKFTLLGALLGTENVENFQSAYTAQWRHSENLVPNVEAHPLAFNSIGCSSGKSLVERMMYADTMGYLPNDILQKVDRAAMANSLETRVPMLDHRIVEYLWSLPPEIRLKGSSNKWMLKQILSEYVPLKLFDRPKMGFGVPVDEWLRGPLKDWAEELLSERRLLDQGFLKPKIIRARWHEHLAGAANWRDPLWTILSFQAWVEKTHST